MPLPPANLLQLIVSASLALAGFAGIVVAISQGQSSKLSALQRLSLVNLLGTSFGSLFLSLLALLLLSTEIDEALTWQAISALGIALAIAFGSYSTQTVIRSIGASRRHMAALLLINLPLLAICIVQIWNIFSLKMFWPIFLLLSAYFAIGCYSFVRLLLTDNK